MPLSYVYVLLTGCRHEGYSVFTVKLDETAAMGAWANLKGAHPCADHRMEKWSPSPRQQAPKKVWIRNQA